jgi:hypothetical protein
VENVPLLGRVPELKLLREPRHLRISPEMTKGEAVKRRNRQVLRGKKAERTRDARFHLVSGLFGEGEREDASAVHSLPYQMNETGSERRRLAGPGACQHQLVPSSAGRRHPLACIEVVHTFIAH